MTDSDLDDFSVGLLPVAEAVDWRRSALCAQTDPEIFFPEKGGTCDAAKRVCLGCSVRDECLDYALSAGEDFGVWGGLSARQLKALRRNAGVWCGSGSAAA
ncbi:WhiB family transcriptional regulator [Antrihabitans spumae]|uniref:Transcriptional regulator WhiB n=1 Tax=Antrihabitans spumae TaxID=3373370 RepID=A0ABW7KH02_9NOCA